MIVLLINIDIITVYRKFVNQYANKIFIYENEMMMVDGGNMGTAMGVFVGVLAIAWSPVVACVCPPAAVGMALGGAGIIGKATGAY